MTSSAASSSFSGQTVTNDEGNSEESDDFNTGDESSSLLGKGQQPVQERREWDRFTSIPPVIISGSMVDQTCMQVSLQIVKFLAYICTFILVLGGAVLSKGTLLFMTSQLRTNVTIEYCNGVYDKEAQLQVPPQKNEIVGWIWCLFFAYIIPEIFAFLCASQICFFKKMTKPTILQFCVVATAETLKTIGSGLLVFMLLPNLDVVKGAMLTNCLCFVPGLIALFNGLQEEVNGRQEDVNGLKEVVYGLQEEVSVRQEEVNGLHEEVNGLQEEVNGRQEVVNDLHGEVNCRQKEVNGLHEEVNGRQEEVNSLHEEVNGLQVEVNGRPGAAYYVRQAINGLAVAAQLTGFLVWSVGYKNLSLSVLHPIALFLISCGWWENFMAATKIPAVLKFLEGLQDCRYYTLLYVSVWKIVCFFCIMLVVTHCQFGSLGVEGDFTVGDLFDLFSDTFSQRNITVTEVNLTMDQEYPISTTSSSTLWVLLIHALGSYICYISGKFACRILIQGIGFALPVTITVPVVVSLLITFSDPWHFEDIIPKYLFFHSPDCSKLPEYLNDENIWVWLLWLLSQFWITLHIWKPNVDRLMPTEVLFTMPMYDSMFVDQSLALNRRHDKERAMLIEDHVDNDREEDEARMSHYSANMKPGDDPVKDTDHIRRVFACVTMWHETPDEMKQMLKSVFRMDSDQAARRLAQKHLGVVDPDYYEFEAHVFFEDAFELIFNNGDKVVVNKYVKDLMDTVDRAATEVHSTECHLGPPVKFPTPYGGRFVWTLPGKTKMIVHLKNKDKIRHKKRWSQVMYMYYLLGHRLMEQPISLIRKAVIARNTFILALDGDIDFKPEAVLMLLDLMKKDPKLGAACGRIHPTGKGPIVWYQRFEYAICHWMQKATEHVIGCVLCSSGCFSLYRGEALMDDSVMHKYATVSTEAKHYVQYDQGEDRWLSTLLLKRGYRVEYSAASDAYTHCPESFDEFYNQRRRWIPSTMANTIDLLTNYKQTVKINDNVSFFYIIYQGFLLGGSIVGPGSFFLMIMGVLAASFKIDDLTNFLCNFVPILIFMFLCYFCKERIQLTAAKIISTIYALVMMAVLVSITLQINVDGPLAAKSLIVFVLVGELMIAAMLHPQEFWCWPAGLVYYVAVPSTYVYLIVYAIFNLNVVSWGTREEATKKSKTEIQQENKSAQKANNEAELKPFFRIRRRDRNPTDNERSSEVSIVTNFNCMCCTDRTGGEEKLPLVRNEYSLENRSRGLDNNERAVDPETQSRGPTCTTFRHSKRDLEPMMGNEEKNLDDVTDSSMDCKDSESKEVRDDPVNPYWIDHHLEMNKGDLEFLPSSEVQFWNDLIKKYLYPLNEDEKNVQEDTKRLKDLRDLTVFAFCMLNVLFVLVILLLQLNKDLLYDQWPIYAPDPIGVLFVVCYGIILIIQFIGMFFHRFGTLSHMLATTQITWCQRAAQSDDKDMEARIAVQIAKDMQALRGADGDDVEERDLMQENVGRRKTIINIDRSHRHHQEKPGVRSLDVAFKRRMTKARLNDVLPERYLMLSVDRREKVSRIIKNSAARQSIEKDREIKHSRQESISHHKNNKQPDAMPPIKEEDD